MHDPQLLRDMFVEVEDPIFGKVKLPASPFRFSDTTTFNNDPPPLIGQSTEEVLTRMVGLSSEDISELRSKKVI